MDPFEEGYWQIEKTGEKTHWRFALNIANLALVSGLISDSHDPILVIFQKVVNAMMRAKVLSEFILDIYLRGKNLAFCP